ncbi:MAG TPA: NAD+ synthase [Polyangiales bacterium]|nr:NAD+ synthase [Polyangiales bacterium]
MRLALCQFDATVGDLDGNRALIRDSARQAHARGADLAVFCELAITGYPPRDLVERPAFVDAGLRALDALARELPPSLATLVGFVDRRVIGQKPTLYNAAALLRGGGVEQIFHKRLLPTYDVFDEARYFEEGHLPLVFEHGGLRCGVTLCEDAWNDGEGPLRRIYAKNPVADCFASGADLLLNLAASPFTLQKRLGRADMLADIAERYAKPVAFVNALGGNDDLVFDGSSVLFNPDGTLCARAASFAPDLVTVDLGELGPVRDAPVTESAAALEALTLGTRDYAHKCGFKSAVVGLSGGIDSALVAAIAVRALGASHVLGVVMPTRYSSDISRSDAEALAKNLGITLRVIDVDPIFETYLRSLGPELDALHPATPDETTFENIQARIRGNTLMAISNRCGHLMLTTGNKSELAVGHCTLYGDMAGGLAVISDVPKTFVYKIARQVNEQARRELIPERIFTRPPSAELRPNQVDQDTLPPYELLDAIIERFVEQGHSVQQIVAQGFAADVVTRVVGMLRMHEYKRRQLPPGLIITSKAFGPGRRYPIAQRFRG